MERRRIIQTILGIIFLTVGLGVVYLGWTDMQQQNEMLSTAEPINGTMQEKWVERDERRETDRTGSTTTTDTEITYDPRVRFTYTYQEETHNGTNIYPGSISQNYNSEAKAESLLSEFPASGEQVSAYVSPDYPDQAFLKKESSSTWPVIAIGAIFAIVGLFVTKAGLLGSGNDG